MYKIIITNGIDLQTTNDLNTIKKELNKYGYKVFTIDKITNKLLNNNMNKNLSEYEFGNMTINLSLYEENLFEKNIKNKHFSNKSILLLDGCIMDLKKYLVKGMYNHILHNKYNLTESDIVNAYDAIFYITPNKNHSLSDPINILSEHNNIINSYIENRNFKIINENDILNHIKEFLFYKNIF